MNADWDGLKDKERADALRRDMERMAAAIGAVQNDLTGLMRRFTELEAQQNSTYGLVNEVIATVEKFEAKA